MNYKNNHPLTIVIVVTYTYPFIGSGLGNVAMNQAEGLAALGHRVHVISSNIPNGPKKLERNGVTYHKCNALNFLNAFDIPVPLFAFSREIISIIQKADIVHAHDMLYPSSLQAAVWSKIFNTPFILTQHVGMVDYKNAVIDLLETIVRKTMGEIVLRLSNRILVINSEVTAWLGPAHSKKTETLINGVDTSLFQTASEEKKRLLRDKHSLPQDKKIVLFVGRLVGKKGIRELFNARSNAYHLLYVGTGEVPEDMQDKENVQFFGGTDQKTLSEIYQACDVFILPSYCEGFPLSIQEAMASGLPIVTSFQQGYEKYLDSMFVEYVHHDSTHIRATLETLLTNPARMKEMSEYSRKFAETRISWEINVTKLLKIFEEVRT